MKALVLSPDPELKARIGQIFAACAPPIGLVTAMPGMNSGTLVTTVKPDLVLLDTRPDASAKPDESIPVSMASRLEQLGSQFPQAALVLLCQQQTSALLLDAMHAGVREVLSLPLHPQELATAVERISQKRSVTEKKDGKILAFMSCKGGSGTTFIAANLAYVLATSCHKKTLLIDLNPQFGDAALYLSDARPGMTLSDVCAQINRLDADLLESSVIRITPNFGVLAAADNPDPANEVRPGQIDVILQLARRHYDYVVLDIGRQISALTVRALDSTDGIYPILQQSLPFLRDGRRLLDSFSSLGYRKEKIHLTLNRFNSASTLRLADIERTLGHALTHVIPNNFDVVNESINQGLPVMQLARNSNISRSLLEFGNGLTDALPPNSISMIRRLFVRHGNA